MTPAQRVTLDRRIAEEGMVELNPHGTEPDWSTMFDGWIPNAWTMTIGGDVPRMWTPLDQVEWRDVVAIRVERPWGAVIDVEEFGEPDYEGDEHAEPDSIVPHGVEHLAGEPSVTANPS